VVKKINIGATRKQEVDIEGPEFLPVYGVIGGYFEIPKGKRVTLIERSTFKSDVIGRVKWVVEGYEELPSAPTRIEGPYR